MTPADVFKMHCNKANLVAIFEDIEKKGASVGKDGTTIEAFRADIDNQIAVILRKIRDRTYSFTTYKEKLISKGAWKRPRQVSIPTIRDKIVLKLVAKVLGEIYPEHKGRVPHEYVRDIRDISYKIDDTYGYLRLDIENFFPTIRHDILLKIIRRRTRQKNLLSLIVNAISTPTSTAKSEWASNENGVPQGLSIANILSSIYMTDIDAHFTKTKDIKYFRYVDDILIIGELNKINKLSQSVPDYVWSKAKVKCHRIGQSDKSKIAKFSEGIDYLGYKFRGGGVSIRESSYKKMFDNLMKNVTAISHSNNLDRSLWKLNLRITGCHFMNKDIGWIFFFSQTENVSQLKYIDEFLKNKLETVLENNDLNKVKRFVKAYHEVRYNKKKSKYFPNFDEFNFYQKTTHLIFLGALTKSKAQFITEDEVNILFAKTMAKEVSDAEKDMLEAFS